MAVTFNCLRRPSLPCQNLRNCHNKSNFENVWLKIVFEWNYATHSKLSNMADMWKNTFYENVCISLKIEREVITFPFHIFTFLDSA